MSRTKYGPAYENQGVRGGERSFNWGDCSKGELKIPDTRVPLNRSLRSESVHKIFSPRKSVTKKRLEGRGEGEEKGTVTNRSRQKKRCINK